jgi:hypothetical protein
MFACHVKESESERSSAPVAIHNSSDFLVAVKAEHVRYNSTRLVT